MILFCLLVVHKKVFSTREVTVGFLICLNKNVLASKNAEDIKILKAALAIIIVLISQVLPGCGRGLNRVPF